MMDLSGWAEPAKPGDFIKDLNRAYTIKNFTGDNHQEIADHLEITKRSVYRILKD